MILVIFCQTTLLQNHSQCLLLNIYSNKCNKRYFSVWQDENTKNEHAHIKKKRKFEEKVIKKGEQFLNIYRPVNEWHAIELAQAHTHQHQYLFMQATTALAKLYMINSFMFFFTKSP